MTLTIADTFNQELPADPERENARRQVREACFSYVTPRVPTAPQLLHVSEEMLEAIGLRTGDQKQQAFLEVFSGAKVLPGTEPYAMCYGGHQFGNWAGQLGDGRAINLAEVVHEGQRWALQLKGAGETPYSRRADGLAVLRSSIREHLCSEAMYHLGVPTTRSLSLMLTGDQVLRDVMYDGNPAYEKGAVVCRVAPSFIRFGNFQIFTSRRDEVNLKKLADYTIRHFYPEITVEGPVKYVRFFAKVVDRSMDMVIHWQRVGFVHGVMNTDNMSILGLTIDYGPYGWLEGYDDNWTPNTTDRSHRRYRYGNQPAIVLWNLAQLGSALVPLVGEPKPLQELLDGFRDRFVLKYQAMMRSKIGLITARNQDEQLIADLEELLQSAETDMTIFFRQLGEVSADEPDVDRAFAEVEAAFYDLNSLPATLLDKWKAWFGRYLDQLQQETRTDRQRREAMHAVNPKYVLRNYMAQLVIDQADKGDYALIDELHQLLKQPYTEQPDREQWFAKRPEWARHKVGCSMLSCSS